VVVDEWSLVSDCFDSVAVTSNFNVTFAHVELPLLAVPLTRLIFVVVGVCGEIFLVKGGDSPFKNPPILVNAIPLV